MQVLGGLCVISYWIDTLVLKTEGNTYATLLHHPFLFKGKATHAQEVACTMLYGLEPGLQNVLKRHGAYEMFLELKLVFQTHARIERYETSDKYLAYKLEENSSTSVHVLRMFRYYNHLNQVGVNLLDKIVIDRVL